MCKPHIKRRRSRACFSFLANQTGDALELGIALDKVIGVSAVAPFVTQPAAQPLVFFGGAFPFRFTDARHQPCAQHCAVRTLALLCWRLFQQTARQQLGLRRRKTSRRRWQTAPPGAARRESAALQHARRAAPGGALCACARQPATDGRRQAEKSAPHTTLVEKRALQPGINHRHASAQSTSCHAPYSVHEMGHKIWR